MELQLSGKRVLVTGASKGIGAGIAYAFAEEGCNLVLVARTKPDLDRVKTEIEGRHGINVMTAEADLSYGGNIKDLARNFPDVDILVNNAGALPAGSIFDVGEEQWREAWDLKVFGYINMCREFYPEMKCRGGGVIINIIGVGGVMKYPWYMCGAAGNASLYAFTQALGSESHQDNIRVIGVSPGPIPTDRTRDMADQRVSHGEDPQKVLDFGRRWGTKQEVANVVVFAASGKGGYLSGTVINVDLGLCRS